MHGQNCNSSSCCGGRNFLTRDEKVEMLGEHKDWLVKETKGIEEKILQLKNQK